MMKFLLIPGNNSLSHVAKSLALASELSTRGHQVLVAVSKKHSPFLRRLNIVHAVLPDIQEADDGPVPSWEWFRRVDRIQACMQAEFDLMTRYRPDRVLGIFRFTAKVSAAAAGIDYDTLVCGCMLRDHDEVLGFAPGDSGAGSQAEYLNNFFTYAGRKISRAADHFGVTVEADARAMFEGRYTFLWDFPEFMPLPGRPGRLHVGPLQWDHWSGPKRATQLPANVRRPLALISFGTCCASRQAAQRLVDCLLDQGYHVTVAAGGQPDLMQLRSNSRHMTVCAFAPLKPLIQRAALVISHGGQMTLFESMAQGVPVLVMPFQPEQAHNGVCLERLGCGRRLIPAVAYRGDSAAYVAALSTRTRPQIQEVVQSVTLDPETATRLSKYKALIGAYRGAERMADIYGTDLNRNLA
jgi:UDP:flavonoid glycosyltransferase YjiC (YdhE family)